MVQQEYQDIFINKLMGAGKAVSVTYYAACYLRIDFITSIVTIIQNKSHTKLRMKLCMRT